jgi:diguanylate cyclase (GGDEF)-like protein
VKSRRVAKVRSEGGRSPRQHLAVLYDINSRLAAVQQTDEILTLLVNEAERLLDADAAGLRLVEGQDLVLRAHTAGARTLMSRTLRIGESIAGRAVVGGDPVIVEDLAADTRHDRAHKQAALDLGFQALVAVPLRAHGRPLGVLSLFTRRRLRVTPDQLSLLLAFADQAALALEKDRLLQAAQTRADRLAALARLNQALTSSLDVASLLRSIADAGAELMAAPAAGLWIADDRGESLTLRAFANDTLGATAPDAIVPFGAGIVGWVARHRRPRTVPVIADDPQAGSLGWFTANGVTSLVAVPVLFQEALLGVLALFGRSPIAIEGGDQHLLDNFAAQAGVALRNARLYEELRVQRQRLERRTAELDLLNRMGELLQASATEEEAYEVFATFIRRFFPEESPLIAVINPSRNLLHVRAAAAPQTMPHGEDVFAPDDCWALRRGRSHLVDAFDSRLVCRHLNHVDPRRSFCIPLMAQGEAVGLLSFVQPRSATDPQWDDDHQRLAVTVADQLGLAIANLRLRETLRSQSVRDPLTGLFNRRYMEETLEREMARAERSRRPLTVVMLDLDHFKEFNDTHGHDAGDVMLREMGALLRTHIRRSDLACRYGGEEFVLILPDATAAIGLERAQHLLGVLRGVTVPVRGRTVSMLTFSAGVASFPEHCPDAASLVQISDRALYIAKRQGRNRVLVAETVDLGATETPR